MEERLQKVLARAGVSSRRKAEELIERGRVSVDGRIVTELGTKVDARRARVELDGRRLVSEPLVYIVLHKPRSVMSTLNDPEGRPTVADYVKSVGIRVFPVGRLDFHTSGVLLFTNDGEFSSALQHPRTGAPKVYVAKVQGEVSDADLERFGKSIEIDGRPTQPAQVRRIRFAEGKTWIEVVLREGRNRQVRRLGEQAGFPVMRLARQSHAGVTIEGLRPGEWRHLTAAELADLKQHFGVPRKVRRPDEAIARGAAKSRVSAGEAKRIPRAASARAAAHDAPSRERDGKLRPGKDRRTSAGRRTTELTRRTEADRDLDCQRAPSRRERGGGRGVRGAQEGRADLERGGRGAVEERAPRGRGGRGASDDRAPRGRGGRGVVEERAPRGGGGRGASDDRAPRGRGGRGVVEERAPRGGGGRGASDDRAPRGRGGRGAFEERAPRSRGGRGADDERAPRARGGRGADDDRAPRGRGGREAFEERAPRGRGGRGVVEERARGGRVAAGERGRGGREPVDERGPRARGTRGAAYGKGSNRSGGGGSGDFRERDAGRAVAPHAPTRKRGAGAAGSTSKFRARSFEGEPETGKRTGARRPVRKRG